MVRYGMVMVKMAHIPYAVKSGTYFHRDNPCFFTKSRIPAVSKSPVYCHLFFCCIKSRRVPYSFFIILILRGSHETFYYL